MSKYYCRESGRCSFKMGPGGCNWILWKANSIFHFWELGKDGRSFSSLIILLRIQKHICQGFSPPTHTHTLISKQSSVIHVFSEAYQTLSSLSLQIIQLQLTWKSPVLGAGLPYWTSKDGIRQPKGCEWYLDAPLFWSEAQEPVQQYALHRQKNSLDCHTLYTEEWRKSLDFSQLTSWGSRTSLTKANITYVNFSNCKNFWG